VLLVYARQSVSGFDAIADHQQKDPTAQRIEVLTLRASLWQVPVPGRVPCEATPARYGLRVESARVVVDLTGCDDQVRCARS